MEKVLITGGAGFIGSNLALKLKRQGYQVVVMDNLSPQIHGDQPDQSYTYRLIKDEVAFIKGDVQNKEDWQKALQDTDVVVHLAAETGTGQSMYEMGKYVSVNIGGTANLFDILANEKHNVRKVIVAASRAVYGEGKYFCEKDGVVFPLPRTDEDMSNGDFSVKCPICHRNVEMLSTDESAELHPTSIYGLTKQTQEAMTMIAGESLHIPVVVFRFQNVFGPGQSLKNPYTGILSIFSTRIKNGNGLNIFEDGKETRDFVFIDDVTDAVVLGIQKDSGNHQIFNVGSGEKHSVYEIAKTLSEKYGVDTEMQISGNYRLGDIRHNVGDLKKIKQLLGYEPKVSFKEGISRFVNWVDHQKVEKDDYERSISEMREKGLYK